MSSAESSVAQPDATQATTLAAHPPLSWTVPRLLIVLWGVGGVILLLGQALWKLTPLAIEPITQSMMHAGHWAVYVLWSLMNAYMEGYRGFQKSFSPMVIERATHLARNPTPLYVVLAPFYCMALFAAERKRILVSWFVLFAVFGLIVLIRQLNQPWRGIVDVGVVVGLTWGTLSILYYFVQNLRGFPPPPRRKSLRASAQNNTL